MRWGWARADAMGPRWPGGEVRGGLTHCPAAGGGLEHSRLPMAPGPLTRSTLWMPPPAQPRRRATATASGGGGSSRAGLLLLLLGQQARTAAQDYCDCSDFCASKCRMDGDAHFIAWPAHVMYSLS